MSPTFRENDILIILFINHIRIIVTLNMYVIYFSCISYIDRYIGFQREFLMTSSAKMKDRVHFGNLFNIFRNLFFTDS